MWFTGERTFQIAEANRHVAALTKKVTELEEKLEAKEMELKKKEEDFVTTVDEIHKRCELEVKELNSLIYKQNLAIRDFERDLSKRDSELVVLRKRSRMFDEVLRYKATLGKLTITMEQAEQYASLTPNSRAYMYTQMNGVNDVDAVNTDPAPLAIRGTEFTPSIDLPLPPPKTSPNGKRPSLLELAGN